MNKKNIFTSGLLAVLTITQLNAEPFTGFYAGVNAGWSQLNADAKVNGTYNGATPVIRGKGSHNDFIGGAQFGYSGLISDLYLAGEVNVDLRSKAGLRKNLFLPGADFKFGYRSERVVGYANVGVIVDRFKISTPFDKKKTMAGFRPGFGIIGLYGDFMISTEYTYTQFDSFSKTVTTNGVSTTAKIRPNYHTILVRYSYIF